MQFRFLESFGFFRSFGSFGSLGLESSDWSFREAGKALAAFPFLAFANRWWSWNRLMIRKMSGRDSLSDSIRSRLTVQTDANSGAISETA